MSADILINNIDIESKSRGFYSLPSLVKRWRRLLAEVPEYKHVVVGWVHQRAWAERIKEEMGKENHFMLSEIKGGKLPVELIRLVEIVEKT